MRGGVLAIVTWVIASAALAGDDERHHQPAVMDRAPASRDATSIVASSDPTPIDPASSTTAPIRLTINPEARVSVAMTDVMPPPVSCGAVLDVPVDVVNQGFVTAPLDATLVGNAPKGITVTLDAEPLKGVPAETRMLHVTLTQPGLTDLTVAFRARNEIPDLGGRDRVHFLVKCFQQTH
jgi:hypothetical protein